MPESKLYQGLTQTERVLRAVLRNPRAGITQIDFDLPDVCDGGPPITRVAARINDLKALGHKIEGGGRRHSCKVYLHRGTLTADAAQQAWKVRREPGHPDMPAPSVAAPPTPDEPTRLFVPPPARYGQEAA